MSNAKKETTLRTYAAIAVAVGVCFALAGWFSYRISNEPYNETKAEAEVTSALLKQADDQITALVHEEHLDTNRFIAERLTTLLDGRYPFPREPRKGLFAQYSRFGFNLFELVSVEAGERPLTYVELARICRYFGISVDDFMNPAIPIGQDLMVVRFAKLRIQQRFSPAEFAVAAGLPSADTVRAIESGQRPITAADWLKVQAVFSQAVPVMSPTKGPLT